MQRLRAIMKKELLHIIRDVRSLTIIFLLPLIMLVLYGYAIRLDLKNIPLAVWDADNSQESRELIRAFTHSGYFTLTLHAITPVDPLEVFQERRAKSVLAIPVDYGARLHDGRAIPVQFLSDASESNTATIAGQYAEQIILSRLMSRFGTDAPLPDVRALVLFNPELESKVFVVPGLVAILFMMICALMTSITIAREKETGTLEQILVSPVRTAEIIIGKLFPYMFLASLIGVVVILIAIFWFGAPFVGSPLLLAVFSIVYLLCSLAIGILISTRVRTVQVAMMAALVITMLPSIMLSGFVFPIASMPLPIRILTHIVPARYFLVIIRGIMLKDASLYLLRFQILPLCILTFILLVVSIRRFRTTLE